MSKPEVDEEAVRAFYLSEEKPSLLDTELEFGLSRKRVKAIIGDQVRDRHEAKRGKRHGNQANTPAGKSPPAIENATSVPHRATARYLRRSSRGSWR